MRAEEQDTGREVKKMFWKLYSNIPGIAPAFVSLHDAETARAAIKYHWVKTGIRYDSAEKISI